MIMLSAGSMLFAFDGVTLYVRILTHKEVHDSKPWGHDKEYLRLRAEKRAAKAVINVD